MLDKIIKEYYKMEPEQDKEMRFHAIKRRIMKIIVLFVLYCILSYCLMCILYNEFPLKWTAEEEETLSLSAEQVALSITLLICGVIMLLIMFERTEATYQWDKEHLGRKKIWILTVFG